MGSLKVAVENEPPYPRPGATCWICSKYAEKVRELANPHVQEEVEWATKAAENIGTVQEGAPPVEFWGALVACNEPVGRDPEDVPVRDATSWA